MMFLWIHYQFYAFWRWFLVKVRYYSIDLINKCLSLYWVFLTLEEEWISSSTWLELHKGHNLFSLGKWSIWYRPCSNISLWLLNYFKFNKIENRVECSLRSKHFCEVQEQRTRNESQRQREKLALYQLSYEDPYTVGAGQFADFILTRERNETYLK